MNDRWARRDKKKTQAWYKKYLHSNRKSLNIIIQARINRLAKESRRSDERDKPT